MVSEQYDIQDPIVANAGAGVAIEERDYSPHQCCPLRGLGQTTDKSPADVAATFGWESIEDFSAWVAELPANAKLVVLAPLLSSEGGQ